MKRGRKYDRGIGQIVTMAAFSRACHVNRSSTLRAARTGRVILTDDKLVDVRNSTNRQYMREMIAMAAIRAAPGVEEIRGKLSRQEDI